MAGLKKQRDPLAGKRDVESHLYRAVRNYVEKHGGRIVVIGGIQVQRWPDESPLKFRLAVQCAGTAPIFKESKT